MIQVAWRFCSEREFQIKSWVQLFWWPRDQFMSMELVTPLGQWWVDVHCDTGGWKQSCSWGSHSWSNHCTSPNRPSCQGWGCCQEWCQVQHQVSSIQTFSQNLFIHLSLDWQFIKWQFLAMSLMQQLEGHMSHLHLWSTILEVFPCYLHTCNSNLILIMKLVQEN